MPSLTPASEETKTLTSSQEFGASSYSLYPSSATFPGATSYPGVFGQGLTPTVMAERVM